MVDLGCWCVRTRGTQHLGWCLPSTGQRLCLSFPRRRHETSFPLQMGGRATLLTGIEIGPQMAAEHGVFCIVSQLVGLPEEARFPRGLCSIRSDGTEIARAPLLQEGGTAVTLDPSAIDRSRAASPLYYRPGAGASAFTESSRQVSGRSAPVERYESAPLLGGGAQIPPSDDGIGARSDGASTRKRDEILEIDVELVERTLVEFIREEVCRRRGFERVVVGVSGGWTRQCHWFSRVGL